MNTSMKIRTENTTPRTQGVGIALAALFTLAANTVLAAKPPGTGGGSYQDIKGVVTLDPEHTSAATRLPTGEGVNEFRGDAPNGVSVTYTDGESGGKVRAIVGRNRYIDLDGNTGKKANGGRTAFLDLGAAFGCAASAGVDVYSDGVCDPCEDTIPVLPDARFGSSDTSPYSGVPDNFSFTISGEDYDDLAVGCTVDASATVNFEINGSVWLLIWGPHEFPGGSTYNPGSDPIRVTRVSHDEWRFQTTGQHRAALRLSVNSNQLDPGYHGQFQVKFSGTVTALPGQSTAPVNPHCDVQLVVGAPACVP